MGFTVYLAAERGMCRGVERAISTVELALSRYSGRVYVLHEVVHNKHVVSALAAKGAHFVEDLNEVPAGSVLIFSAHGVGLKTERKARARGLDLIDATCPVVTAVHNKVRRAAAEDQDLVIIGHQGHQEVAGTLGQYEPPEGGTGRIRIILTPEDVDTLDIRGERAVFVTQTTLATDDTARTVSRLRERYPAIRGPRHDDTCSATQDRQNAVRELTQLCDLIVIAGSANSSNSNRLREVAAAAGPAAYLADDSSDIDPRWLDGVSAVGLSAGASVPERIVSSFLTRLKELGAGEVIEVGKARQARAYPPPKLP